MTDVSTDRRDTIRRAIALMDAASPADLTGYLGQTNVHGHLKADPAALRDHLAASLDAGPTLGAWKGAQQILRAAGLPF